MLSAILIKIALFLIAVNRVIEYFDLKFTYDVLMYCIQSTKKKDDGNDKRNRDDVRNDSDDTDA